MNPTNYTKPDIYYDMIRNMIISLGNVKSKIIQLRISINNQISSLHNSATLQLSRTKLQMVYSHSYCKYIWKIFGNFAIKKHNYPTDKSSDGAT